MVKFRPVLIFFLVFIFTRNFVEAEVHVGCTIIPSTASGVSLQDNGYYGCGRGKFYSFTYSQCYDCPANYYQSSPSTAYHKDAFPVYTLSLEALVTCDACPSFDSLCQYCSKSSGSIYYYSGWTIKGEGSNKQCVKNCGPGGFYNKAKSTTSCQTCPGGYYQDQQWFYIDDSASDDYKRGCNQCNCLPCEYCGPSTNTCYNDGGNNCIIAVPNGVRSCVSNNTKKYSYYTDTQKPSNVNAQCAYCNISSSRTAWTNLISNESCDDGNICSKNDKCIAGTSGDGTCQGTTYTCLQNQGPLKNCEQCDGDNGCIQQSGSTCQTVNGSCGCKTRSGGAIVANQRYAYGELNNNIHDQCKTCIVSNKSCGPTNTPAVTTCNDGNMCTHSDNCNGSGSCVGTSYSCPLAPANDLKCAIYHSSYAQYNGCKGDGNCAYVAKAKNSYMCDGKIDECEYDSYCNGSAFTCPQNVQKTRIITKGTVKVHRPLDGHTENGWLDTLDQFKLSLSGWSVPCDVLMYRVGVMQVHSDSFICTADAGKMWSSNKQYTGTVNQATYPFNRNLLDDSNNPFMKENQRYAVIAEFWNVRNEKIVGCSKAFQIDTSAPDVSAGEVKDLHPRFIFNDFNNAVDIDFHDEHKVHAVWNPIREQYSGWAGDCYYKWAVYAASGDSVVMDFVDVHEAEHVTADLSQLQHNTEYYVVVKAYNMAGLSSTFNSNGFFTDFTPPIGIDVPSVDSTLSLSSLTSKYDLFVGVGQKTDNQGSADVRYVFSEVSGANTLIKIGSTNSDSSLLANLSNKSVTDLKASMAVDGEVYVAALHDDGVVTVHTTSSSTISDSLSNISSLGGIFKTSADKVLLVASISHSCACGNVIIPVIYEYNSGWNIIEDMCPSIDDNELCENRSLERVDFNNVFESIWILATDSSTTKSYLMSYLKNSSSDIREIEDKLIDFVGIADVGGIGTTTDGHGYISWPEGKWPGVELDNMKSETTISGDYLLRGDYGSSSTYLIQEKTGKVSITKYGLSPLETPVWNFDDVQCQSGNCIIDVLVTDDDVLFIWLRNSSNSLEMKKFYLSPIADSCTFDIGTISDQEMTEECGTKHLIDPLLMNSPELMPNQDMNFHVDGDWIRAKWGHFHDDETKMSHYTISYGSNDPDYTNVITTTDIGDVRYYNAPFPASKNLAEGVEYKFVVRAYNMGQTYVQMTSDGVRFDSTNPISESVDIISGIRSNAKCPDHKDDEITTNWINNDHISFHTKFYDDESTIRALWWCIRSEGSSECDVMDWTSLDMTELTEHISEHYCFYFADLDLTIPSDEDRILVAIKARNGAGLFTEMESQVVQVDTANAQNGEVLDIRPDAAGDRVDSFAHNTNEYEADWSKFTVLLDDSPIKEYFYTIAADDASADTGGVIGEWVSTGLLQTMRRSALDLNTINQGTFYVYVRCFNEAGNYIEVKSNGVIIEHIKAEFGKVEDGDDITQDYKFIASLNIANAHWTATDTGYSGIEHYEIGIGVCDSNAYSVMPVTPVGMDTSVEFSGLTMNTFIDYCQHIFVHDYATNVHSEWTNGFQVDVTVPTVKSFIDGPGPYPEDVDDLQPHLPVAVTWVNVVDPESGIYLDVCLGTEAMDCSVRDWARVPNIDDTPGVVSSGTYTWDDTVEIVGTYVVTLRMTNQARLISYISTDGFRADTSIPFAGTITHGIQNVDVSISSSLDTLSARWADFSETGSPIIDFSVKLGTTSNGDEIVQKKSVGTATYVTFEDLELVAGTTYYITVIAKNAGSLETTVGAGGIRIDNTPTVPVSVTVREHETGFVASGTTLDIEWAFNDEDLSELSYKYAIGTEPHSTSERDWTIESRSKFTVNDLSLASGQTYYLSIAAITDAQDESSVKYTSAFIVDPVKPMPGRVWDMYRYSDAFYQNNHDSLTGYWTGFFDQTSRLTYQVGIGSVGGTADVSGFVTVVPEVVEGECDEQTPRDCDIDTVFKHTITASLGDGTYYFIVKAVDQAGNFVIVSSNGIIVDSSPPIAGNVFDGPSFNNDIDFQQENDVVSASWNAFNDPHSGIRMYRWAIGTEEDSESIMSFKSVGLSTSATAKGLTLISNQKYIITVEAMNKAKSTIQAQSDGFYLNLEDPEFEATSHIYQWGGKSTSSNDRTTCECSDSNATFFPSLAECVCPPSHFFDARIQECVACESGTHRGYSHRSICGNEAVPAYPSAKTIPSYSQCDTPKNGFVKDDDVCVCAPGKFLNDNGDCEICSEGTFKWLAGNNESMCQSCPPNSAVLMIEMPDIDNSGDAIPYDDAEFIYSVGTTSKGEQWIKMGASEPHKAEMRYEFNLPWTHDTKYYVQVEGTNEARLTSVSHAISEVVDDSSPIQGGVFDGDAGADIKAQFDDSKLSASWFNFRDPQTGIANYLVGIGSAPGLFDIVSMQDLGLKTNESWDFVSAPLEHNKKYYVTVTAVNGFGLTTTAFSNGILVDTSKPIGTVLDGSEVGVDIDYQTSTNKVSATWSINDFESGLTRIEWAIGTESNTEEFMSFKSVGLSSRGTKSNLNIPHGTKYIISIRAFNGAGNSVILKSDGCTIDTVAPTLTDLTFERVAAQLPNGIKDVAGSIMYQSGLTVKPTWTINGSLSPIISQTLTVGKCPFGAHSVLDINVEVSGDTIDQSQVQLKELYDGVLAFEHGSRYCYAVSIETAAGVVVRERSVASLMIDTTGAVLSEPTVEKIGKGDMLKIDESSGKVCFELSWVLPSDPESTVLQQINVVCTAESCDRDAVILESDSLHSAIEDRIWCSSELNPGRQYWVGIRAINGAHVTSFAVVPFTLDSTPPVVTVNDGSIDDEKDRDYTSDQGSLSAFWSIDEPECDVITVEASIWKLIDESDPEMMIDWIDADLHDHITLEIQMESGITYAFKIRATNAAGLIGEAMSDGIMYDSSAPESGNVCVHRVTQTLPESLKPECDCACCDSSLDVNASECSTLFVPTSDEQLMLRWFDQSDEESDIKHFYAMLGTSTESDQISRWFGLSSQKPYAHPIPSKLGEEFTLAVERAHTFTLRTTNNAGLTSLSSSSLVRVDETTPDCSGNIGDEAKLISAFYNDGDFSQLKVEIDWEECEDVQSGLAGVLVENNLVPLNIGIMKSTVDPSYYETTLDMTNVTNGDELTFDIGVWNLAGAKTNLGISFVVDKTVPMIGQVRDGARPNSQEDRNLDCQMKSSSMGVNWDEFLDDESEVTKYEVALGTCAGCDDIVSFVESPIGNGVRSYSFGSLSNEIIIGKMYYASVRATNSFGLSSIASTDGVRIVCDSDDETCEALYGAYKCLSL